MGGHRSKSPRKESGSATKIVYVYGLIVDTFFEFFESRQCPYVVPKVQVEVGDAIYDG